MDSPNNIFIYGLVDKAGHIRYIGKSHDIYHRIASHISEAKSGEKHHRANWIRQQLKLGHTPTAKILEVVTEETWRERERYWIKFGRESGWNLVNGTNGGDGLTGFKHSEESKKQMSLNSRRKTARPHSPESYQRDAEKKKGRLQPKEAIAKREETNKKRRAAEKLNWKLNGKICLTCGDRKLLKEFPSCGKNQCLLCKNGRHILWRSKNPNKCRVSQDKQNERKRLSRSHRPHRAVSCSFIYPNKTKTRWVVACSIKKKRLVFSWFDDLEAAKPLAELVKIAVISGRFKSETPELVRKEILQNFGLAIPTQIW